MPKTLIEKKNPLKQGLKLNGHEHLLKAIEIEKKNPLKQGLKHFWTLNFHS